MGLSGGGEGGIQRLEGLAQMSQLVLLPRNLLRQGGAYIVRAFQMFSSFHEKVCM